MTETKKIRNKSPKQLEELHRTSLYGITVTANSKEELAQKLMDMRMSCR